MVGLLRPAEGHVIIVVTGDPRVKHFAYTQRPLETCQCERQGEQCIIIMFNVAPLASDSEPEPVSPLPEELRHAGEVARVPPPVGAKVVESRGVGRAPGQQRHPAGTNQRSVFRSRDQSGPIRGQDYLGPHTAC